MLEGSSRLLGLLSVSHRLGLDRRFDPCDDGGGPTACCPSAVPPTRDTLPLSDVTSDGADNVAAFGGDAPDVPKFDDAYSCGGEEIVEEEAGSGDVAAAAVDVVVVDDDDGCFSASSLRVRRVRARCVLVFECAGNIDEAETLPEKRRDVEVEEEEPSSTAVSPSLAINGGEG